MLDVSRGTFVLVNVLQQLQSYTSCLATYLEEVGLLAKDALSHTLLSMLRSFSKSVLLVKLFSTLLHLLMIRRTDLSISEYRAWALPETIHGKAWLEVVSSAHELRLAILDLV